MGQDLRHALLLGLLALAVYLTNLQLLASGDTAPARWLPFSTVREGDLDLDEFSWLRRPGYDLYHLQQDSSGRWFSKYPITPGLAAVPAAWLGSLWLARTKWARTTSDTAWWR